MTCMPKQPCKEEVIERIVGLSRYQIMDHYQYEFFYMLHLEIRDEHDEVKHSEARMFRRE